MSETYYSRDNPISPERLAEAMRVNGPIAFERAARAVNNVHERLDRAVSAFESRSIPYAIVGGNAVAAWGSSVDPGVVRTTVDVDLLIKREDLEQAKLAMAAAGFWFTSIMDVGMFIDGPNGRARDAVQLIYAGEPVKAGATLTHP